MNNDGMAVGTISLENIKKISGRHSFAFKVLRYDFSEFNFNVDENPNSQPDVINIKNSNFDIKENDKRIYLFSIVRPAGKYEFNLIQIHINTGSMQSVHTLPIKVPFKIEKGKITYVGEINFKVKKAQVQLIDNVEYDRKLFQDRYPDIKF